MPFPRTESGVELDLLKALFTEEEARAALSLSAVAEPIEAIRRRVGNTDAEGLAELLDNLARKGAINTGVTRVGSRRMRTYGLAPLVIGMFEFQVDKLTPEYVRDFRAYLDEGFRESIVGVPTAQVRTVPVRAEFASGRRVARYENIREYVASHPGPFSVINCVCRQSAEILGEACSTSATHETCLMIGGVAEHGREITADEVLSILDRAEREGHVLQPQNSRRPGFICCCCRDCCEILRNARKLPRPADAVPSAFSASIDGARCTECGLCLKRCPMGAITLTGRCATVTEDRCIGCGLCATTCPADAVSLVRRKKRPRTPRTTTSMYLRMYADRFGPLRLVRIAFEKLLGRRI